MPVTRDQIIRLLSADEPDYAAAARLGPGALPFLEQIAREEGPGLAAKAVYLASIISGAGSVAVVDAAARRTDPVVRVAAASALRNVPEERMADIAVRLLADPESGVRRRAVAALPDRPNPMLRQRLADLADSLPEGDRRGHVIEALHKTR
jgi:HEAT repeat protein